MKYRNKQYSNLLCFLEYSSHFKTPPLILKNINTNFIFNWLSTLGRKYLLLFLFIKSPDIISKVLNKSHPTTYSRRVSSICVVFFFFFIVYPFPEIYLPSLSIFDSPYHVTKIPHNSLIFNKCYFTTRAIMVLRTADYRLVLGEHPPGLYLRQYLLSFYS